MFDIYKNKRVFITGHTGFKGSWLSIWFASLGAKVCGYSLEPDTYPSMFKKLEIYNNISRSVIGDILDNSALEKTISKFKPEIIFHLAAQPLVRLSYKEPLLTYKTNVIGTLNVLEAARKCPSVKAFVNITTDKCYENIEQEKYYKEDDPLGGYDMYSSSKGCVEIMSSSYRRSFLQEDGSMLLATARAGNVIGGGDWALDRIIPDCIRAVHDNRNIEIRNPIAVRPWQHVLEPLSGYLLLGEKLLNGEKEFASSFNFGPEPSNAITVAELAEKFVELYGSGKVIVGEMSPLHEAGLLMLSIDKSKRVLGWQPQYDTETALRKTVDWYKHFYNNDDMYKFTIGQIKDYEICMNRKCRRDAK